MTNRWQDFQFPFSKYCWIVLLSASGRDLVKLCTEIFQLILPVTLWLLA